MEKKQHIFHCFRAYILSYMRCYIWWRKKPYFIIKNVLCFEEKVKWCAAHLRARCHTNNKLHLSIGLLLLKIGRYFWGAINMLLISYIMHLHCVRRRSLSIWLQKWCWKIMIKLKIIKFNGTEFNARTLWHLNKPALYNKIRK